MVLAPWAGDRLKGEGLTALGGATAMDTTLYFITRYGDREAGSLALTSGFDPDRGRELAPAPLLEPAGSVTVKPWRMSPGPGS